MRNRLSSCELCNDRICIISFDLAVFLHGIGRMICYCRSMPNHQHRCLRDLIRPRGHTTRSPGSDFPEFSKFERTLSNAAIIVRCVYYLLLRYSGISVNNSSCVQKKSPLSCFVWFVYILLRLYWLVIGSQHGL